MSHFDLWQEASKQRDQYLGQRNELLAVAKKVVGHANQREPHLRDLGYEPYIREFQRAIARAEGRS